MPKYVYDFAEGNRFMADLLGGKGANLAEMTVMGLPVPPGFTITTEACRAYLATGAAPEELSAEVSEHLHRLEQAMGRKLCLDPLLPRHRPGLRVLLPVPRPGRPPGSRSRRRRGDRQRHPVEGAGVGRGRSSPPGWVRAG